MAQYLPFSNIFLAVNASDVREIARLYYCYCLLSIHEALCTLRLNFGCLPFRHRYFPSQLLLLNSLERISIMKVVVLDVHIAVRGQIPWHNT